MTTTSAGYSGKPLRQKLGIKPGFRVKSRNAPDRYLELLGPLPEGARVNWSGLKLVVRREYRK